MRLARDVNNLLNLKIEPITLVSYLNGPLAKSRRTPSMGKFIL
jgi:hypothetical protein